MVCMSQHNCIILPSFSIYILLYINFSTCIAVLMYMVTIIDNLSSYVFLSVTILFHSIMCMYNILETVLFSPLKVMCMHACIHIIIHNVCMFIIINIHTCMMNKSD